MQTISSGHNSTYLSATAKSKLAEVADWLIVATAALLPWSTSAVSILTIVWVLVAIPSLKVDDLRREILTPFSGLPVLLFLLGLIGMAWGDVEWHDRLGGLSGFVKLLVIPLLVVQFSRSDRGKFVFWAFLGSCCLLLIGSVIVSIWPNIPRGSHDDGVVVKAYIIQSIEFTICAAALIDIAVVNAGKRFSRSAIVPALLATAFLIDIFFIATGRTTLVIMVSICAVYGLRRSGWKGALIGGAIAAVVLGLALVSSPYLYDRVSDVRTETQQFLQRDAQNSSGLRIVFWQRSLRFIKAAPLVGNGTGSIRPLFAKAVVGKEGALAEPSTNPHNQTFAVGIQLGLMGILVLWAMWIAHFARFWTTGFVAWVGLVLAIQNIVGSLFNSFVFDFTEGWLYVLGMGVTAGMLASEMRRRDSGALTFRE